MAWNVIRKATDLDVQILEARAREFCRRNRIPICTWMCAREAIAIHLETLEDDGFAWGGSSEARRLRKNWRRVVRRALHEPQAEDVAWGTVGYHAKD